ncbi:MogA/MoaB family molybdenum cofactor biosynthesis protein [Paludisphaera rhizosphaerae]|uniref:MogA/MoaB family molybdenum cofactor biosynthesis protein n=1 Tax=Paludisphaera rhizosphaerae TaxID=2711216 RepID=UPI0013EDDD5B|nr:molybdenum cofactor biosynthesis protein B [Paludisphaera rhizosphaerae]
MSKGRSVDEHRAEAPKSLTLAVLTVSDTRTTATDASGALIVELAETAGHRVIARAITPDEPEAVRAFITARVGEHPAQPAVDAVLVTGGTGISPRDQTYETVSALLTKPLPGYGELFRMLSYEQIGPACMLSRAVGGLMDRTVILVMPGSRAAVELAMTKIILPELPHLVREARKG